MSTEALSVWFFVASFVLPVVVFVIARAWGVKTNELAGVIVGFWVFSLLSTGFASWALLQKSAVGLLYLLVTNLFLYAFIVLPRALARIPSAKTAGAGSPSNEIAEKQEVACVPQLVNRGGGPVPFSRSGKAGNVGWYFGVANYYIWTLRLNVTATASSATGTASATGDFSAWYSFSFTKRNAISTATGNISCERINDKCEADARGGQDQDTDVDYSSAVVIKGSSTGSKATLDVEVAAAVAGQVAISSVTVGGTAGGVTVGATINLPNTANDKKKIGRSYTYRCTESSAPTA